MIWPFVSAVRLEPGLLLDSKKKPTENMAAPITASGPVAATSSAPGWTEAGGRDQRLRQGAPSAAPVPAPVMARYCRRPCGELARVAMV
jgi:hypothetical protein